MSFMLQHKIESSDIDISTKKFNLHRNEFEGEHELIRVIPDFEEGTSNNIHELLEKCKPGQVNGNF